jgi:TatD DNase family protein
MPIYETHCHLNHKQFEGDYVDVIERANHANIKRLLVVGFDLPSSRRALSITKFHPALRASVGIHPEDGDQWSEQTREEFTDLCRSNPDKIVAWGEIGLDYHWKTHEPDFQKVVFNRQLEVAQELNLPVIIHCRDAYDDTLEVLQRSGTVRAVLHCFSGTVEQALRAVSLGFYIGIGGVITYKNAANVRDVAATIPRDRIVIETDSPFLSPQPFRGKRNEPAYLSAVVEESHLAKRNAALLGNVVSISD